MQSEGFFLVIEGIEGAGKSTAIQVIRDYFKTYQITPVFTREPGGTEAAEAIRDVLSEHFKEAILPETELLLLFAARAQHLAHVIRPALAEKKLVVSDRFVGATFAYQGAGRGLPKEQIEHLSQWILQGLAPNLTIILDVSAEVGMKRIQDRLALDRWETEKLNFYERVRQDYLRQAKQAPTRHAIINTECALSEVKIAIEHLLHERVLPYMESAQT